MTKITQNDSNENQWYPEEIIYIRRKPMIPDENQWYPMPINDALWKSMMSIGNQWYPTWINEISNKKKWYVAKTNGIWRKSIRRKWIVFKKSMISNESNWYPTTSNEIPTKINDFQRKSMISHESQDVRIVSKFISFY